MVNQFNSDKYILRGIDPVLLPNEVRIALGSTETCVTQQVGVIQGDSLSPYLFLLFINDLANTIKSTVEDAFINLFADDLAVACDKPEQLQTVLNTLQDWCAKNKMKVNTSKTQIIKISRGGRKGKKDKFTFNGTSLTLANSYSYLGVTVTPRLSFAKHITRIKARALSVISSLKHLGRLSIKAGIKIFNMRIRPIMMYALHSFSNRLTLNNLIELDRVKSAFLKKLLLIPKFSSVTLTHELCGEERFTQDLISKGDISLKEEIQQVYQEYIEEKGMEFVTQRYTDGPAFNSYSWKDTLASRHIVTGFTAHGFHHLWCAMKGFHNLDESCICKFCKSTDNNRLHGISCPTISGNTLSERLAFISNVS